MSAEPLAATHLIDDVEIGTWEWLGSSSRPGPPVVLCHATGFHGRCWDEIIARLGGRHAIALDFRGHGRSGKPDPPYHWRRFGEDLAKLTEHLQIQGAVAVGHSMGGHSAVLAAAINPRAFSSLLLLDPVILPEGAYTGVREPLDLVLRRKNSWTSADQMFERFQGKPPYQSWDRAVLRDYCDYALAGDALACPPEVEASIYAHSGEPDANIYAEIAEVDTAVHVVRSRESYAYGRFDGSPTAPDLAARFRHGGDEQWLDVSHFIPMEAPRKVAELILRLS
jgi:pimeloyl-ACP methyl ester carboxylesterase